MAKKELRIKQKKTTSLKQSLPSKIIRTWTNTYIKSNIQI